MGATEALKQQTGLAKKPATIQQLLEALKPQMALALPKHLQPERMLRIALTCLRNNPKLAECEPQTILASVMLASQLGLEPGVLGQGYLVPYKRVCTFIPGWMGILDLVSRSGKATAWTGAVYAGDEFDWALGDKPFVFHRPCGDEERLTHVYAIARVKGAEWPIIEVWGIEKIWRHRDKYNKVGGAHYSYGNPEMYARKVPLLQVLKYVPRSVELATALDLDAQGETGNQKYAINDVKNVIEGVLVDHQEQDQLTEGTADPTPETFDENELMSKCAVHGLYKGEGNCPKCDPPTELQQNLEKSIAAVNSRK